MKTFKRIQGDRRGGARREQERRLRVLAAKIPTHQHLEQFLDAAPEADRERIAALLVPYTRFTS